MVYRDPEVDSSTKNTRNTRNPNRSQSESMQHAAPEARLTRSNSSQEKQPSSLTDYLSDDLTLSNTQEGDLASMQFYTQVEERSQAPEPETSSQSESKNKNARPARPSNPKHRGEGSPPSKTRFLPYVHQREIVKYPSDLPPADSSSFAKILQQHLLYLLPTLEEAINDWNTADTEEAQDYWSGVVRSLSDRIDRTYDLLFGLIEPPKKELDPTIAAYVGFAGERAKDYLGLTQEQEKKIAGISQEYAKNYASLTQEQERKYASLVQEYWKHRPDIQDKGLAISNTIPSLNAWKEHPRNRDEAVVVVDE